MMIINKLTNRKWLLHFISYVLVGAIATVAEWVCYYIFDLNLHINTYFSVALAFIISTFVNWLAGRLLTFKNSARQSIAKELASIYGVSAIGLILNELIMFAALKFVFYQHTGLQKMVSKFIATAIVFFWNFFTREFLIYRDVNQDNQSQG